MKKTFLYIVIVLLLTCIFTMRRCEEQRGKVISIEIPERKGDFAPKKPLHINADPVEIVWRTEKIYMRNPVNDSLAKAYQEVKDSLERYKMYLNAIQIRDFQSSFEDSLIKIDLFGKVQGEIQNIKPSYTIKTQIFETEIPFEKPSLSFFAGAGIGNSKDFTDLTYKLSFGVQNKNKSIYSLDFVRMRNEDYLFVGYSFPLFSIKTRK